MIALASNADRVSAVRALTRSRIVTTLITHRQVAEKVLGHL